APALAAGPERPGRAGAALHGRDAAQRPAAPHPAARGQPAARRAAAMSPPAVLAYPFAKAHGVVLLDFDGAAVLGLREGADPAALVEARGALGAPVRVERLSRAEFERRLSEVYAGEGLAGPGDELDLSGGLEGLVEDIPVAADLL